MKKRVIFYFDGFNFYNGLRDRSKIHANWINYYWIDFIKFCNRFLSDKDHDLIAVNYFTAPPINAGKRSRQSALLQANRMLNPEKFIIHNGNYQEKSIECKLCRQFFKHPEEKRTDVNISVHMMMDCFVDKADTLVLVSADSDQIPTINAIKNNFRNKTIKVYFPPERTSTELFNLCKPIVYLGENEDKFKDSTMNSIVEGEGKKYTRPPEWKL